MAEQIKTVATTIKLKDSSDSREFRNKGEIIHLEELNKLNGWIQEHLGNIKPNQNQAGDNPVQPRRYHNTYTILGTRGSGKSSFILSVLDYYHLDKDKRCCVLPLTDPTLIEEKGHIFLHVISIIKHAVEKRIGENDVNADKAKFSTRREWDSLIASFSHGLPLIDGVGGSLKDAKWHDAEYIMDKGLRDVDAAKKLEANFNTLIDMGLKILDKDAFIIAFDDIDIDFRRGWPVLEMIRKYFTSPKLITLISGDPRLFSLAIRKQQWGNFGKALLINEGELQNDIRRFNDRVTEMEGQYLQKVLKPEYRIRLTTLNEKINLKNSFTIIGEVQENEVELVTHYNSMLNEYGIRNPYQAEPYRTHLLGLPLRTQIRFMRVLDTKDYALANISDPFISDLYEKRVNIDLVKSNPGFLNIEVLNLLLREEMLSEAYQLQPTMNDDSLNSCVLALSLTFSQEMLKGNPHLIFDYFIKIGYIRNLKGALGYRESEGHGDKSELVPSINGLCKHAHVTQDKVMRDIVGLITSYVEAYLEKNGNNDEAWGGILSLNSLAKSSKQGASDMYKLDRVLNGESAINRILGFIPASICAFSTKQQSNVVYSVYTLLGCIGDLILRYRSAQSDVNEDLRRDVRQGLIELSQIRSYIMPDFSGGTVEKQTNEPLTLELAEDKDYKIELLNKAVVEWIESFPKEYAISPHTLGKISTRMFYAFENIQRREGQESLGVAFSKRIVAFMNAVLIEDAKENISYVEGLNINNTNETPKIFADNLRAVIRSEKDSSLHFSKWMLACPLFTCYLDLRDKKYDIKKHLISFVGPEKSDLFEFSVFTILSKVSLKGESSSKPLEKDILKNYNSFYNYLSSEKILPFELFKLGDISVTRANNKAIKSELQKKDFNIEKLTSDYLRDFRWYLTAHKLKW